MARRRRIQRVLWVGFGAILVLLSGKWLVQVSQVSQFFALIEESRVASRKMETITAMIDVARARAILTAQMIALEDPFEKDTLARRLDEEAARFVTLREELLAAGLDTDERALLSLADGFVGPAQLAQRRAAEMALSDDPAVLRDANRVITFEVMPQQGRIVDSYMALFKRQREIIQANTVRAEALFDRVIYLISTLTGGTVLATLFVAVLVIRKTGVADRALHREKQRAEVTLGSIGDAVIATDALGRVQYMNPVAEQLTGRAMAASVNRPVGKVFQAREEASGRLISQVIHALGQYGHPEPPSDDVMLRTPRGEELYVALTLAPIRTMEGRVEGVILTFQDVTEARRMARRVAFQAQHDALTGLLNRRAFQENVEQALRLYPNGPHVLCAMDLDRFKPVNDLGGHAAGDALLRQLTAVIRAEVRKGDLVARMGGDEFALFLINTDVSAAKVVAEKLRRAVSAHRLTLQGREFGVGVSMGLVRTPRDGAVEYQRLVQAADAACYDAKRSGRGRVALAADGESKAPEQHRDALIAQWLQQALAADTLVLHGQPVVALHDHQYPPCCELLLRLPDEQGRLLLPDAFLSVAERHGLMPRIDGWVVGQALALLGRRDDGLQLSVNLSAQSLIDADFVAQLNRMLAASDIDPQRLNFELSAATVAAHIDRVRDFARSVCQSGCGLTVDRFGTDWGCFSSVLDLHVRQIKIDAELIVGLRQDATARAMAKAIIDIGRTRGITVGAQGVEDAQTLEILCQQGVDHAQGYHLGPPRPLVEPLLRRVAT